MTSLFVIVRARVYKQQVLGAGVVNTTGVVNMVRLWVSNRSLGVVEAVALARTSLGLGLLNCF